MIEHINNVDDFESKENVLLINNKSILSRDKSSEINTNRVIMKNDIRERK